MTLNDWPFCVLINQTSLDQIRKIIRDEVDKALLAREYPAKPPITAISMQVEDEDKRREELWYEVTSD